MAEREEPAQPVKPRLGLFDAVSIMVGIVIGASIYKTPPLIFGAASSPAWGIGVWVLGGVLSLIGALCYAELASTYPRMGGDYVYLSRAFGSWAGFLFGWAQLAIILTASIGMMAFVFGEYAVNTLVIPPDDVLEQMKAQPDVWQNKVGVSLALIPAEYKAEATAALALVAVIGLSLMNVLGVVLGKWVQNLLSLVKIVGLGAIAYVGFSAIQPEPLAYTPVKSGPNIGFAMILVLYAYGGWNDMAFVAAELKNKRNITRALILGTTLITIIYVAINVAYLLALGFDRASNMGGPPIAAAVLDKELGSFAGKAMSVLVMVSALGAINGLIFAGSRVYSSLGADWGLFALLGRWNQKFGSPLWALLIQAAIAIVMIFVVGLKWGRDLVDVGLGWVGEQLPVTGLAPLTWDKFGGGFDALLAVTAPVFWVFFLGTGLSLFALRQRDADIKRPFSVPLYPLLPLIFCGMCFFMLYKSLAWAGEFALLGWLPLLLGVPLYYLSPHRQPAEALAPESSKPETAPAQEELPAFLQPIHSEPAPAPAPAEQPASDLPDFMRPVSGGPVEMEPAAPGNGAPADSNAPTEAVQGESEPPNPFRT